MISRDEAHILTKNIAAINNGKRIIETRINESVNEGRYYVEINNFEMEMNVKVRDVLADWLKSFGYDVHFDDCVDSRSGFCISTMVISWGDYEEGSDGED